MCGGIAHAQVARSQFNGTVSDPAGGHARRLQTVVATNVETNVESKATTTDEAAMYVIPVPELPASTGIDGHGGRGSAPRWPTKVHASEPRRR
jgi:hypothetical protein